MPFEEKMTWVSLVVAIAVPIWYFATMIGQLRARPPPTSPSRGR